MKRRAILLACALSVPPIVILAPHVPLEGPPSAEAAVSLLVSLDELVAASTSVVVGTSADHYSAWEDLPSGRRIVTYTKITVEQTIVGTPGTEIWVRTLGGVVDDVGQAISGEVEFVPGARTLLFTKQGKGVTVVTSMAQGHYPITVDAKGTKRLAPSPRAGMLIPRRGPSISARERLVGATLDEAVQAIRDAKRANDAGK